MLIIGYGWKMDDDGWISSIHDDVGHDDGDDAKDVIFNITSFFY